MKISPRRAEWGTHMSVTNTHFGAEKISRMLSGRKAVYFLGIGGITMSSMAHITKTMGYRVGGSDRTLSPLTERLAKEGIEIFCGHDASHLDGYDALEKPVCSAIAVMERYSLWSRLSAFLMRRFWMYCFGEVSYFSRNIRRK